MPLDVPAELLSASSGSAGDVVHSRNQYGPYQRARTTPTDPDTLCQQAVKSALSTCSTAWVSTLTQAQREGWDRYALAVRLSGRLGRRNNVGGLPMYVRSNVPRLQAAGTGLSRVDSAPSLQDLGPHSGLERVVLNFNDDTIHPVFTESDAWVSESGAAMLFYASAAQPLTRNFWRGPYRYAGGLVGADPTLSSPGTIYLPQPAAVNERVFVQARVTRADGRLSHTLRLPADATTQAAPVPLFAFFDPVIPRPKIHVLYDQLLRREAATGANWTARYGNTQYGFQGRSISGNLLSVTWRLLAVQPGPNVINYAATPADHHGLFNGVPVAAYANFPVA